MQLSYKTNNGSVLAGLLLVTLLSACGGGGGGSGGGSAAIPPVSDAQQNQAVPVAAGAQGVWSANSAEIAGGTGVEVWILNDGTYYGSHWVTGKGYSLFFGTGSGDASTFTSNNAVDYPIAFLSPEAMRNFSLNASFIAKNSMNVSTTIPFVAGSEVVNLRYGADYETVASLTSVAGVYAGSMGMHSSQRYSNVNLTVQASGAFSATTENGCKLTGSFAPLGTNASLKLSYVSDPLTCGISQSISGIVGRHAGSDQLIFYGIAADSKDAAFWILGRVG